MYERKSENNKYTYYYIKYIVYAYFTKYIKRGLTKYLL